MLENLNAGEPVLLVKDKYNKVNIECRGLIIARLSHYGCEQFQSIINSNYQAKIIAMPRRYSNPENVYEQNNKQEQWWLPVIEVLVKK